MHRILLFCLFMMSAAHLTAQLGKTSFDFLTLPNGIRSSALGGNNVSIIENDLSLIYQNPAFLGQEMDKTINLTYFSYIGDVGVGSATFAKALGERSAWGIGAFYTNYGEMRETDASNTILGDLSASDICTNLFFSRDLTERIRGGVSAKFIYSKYAEHTSYALAVDLGISYYDPERDFSFGLVGKNLGRQIQAYDEIRSGIPWDIQMGFTKRLAHAPFRISVTAESLKRWQFYNLEGEKDPFFTNLLKHFVFGLDFIPTDNLWVALGYHVRRAADLNLEEGNRMGGFTIGAGLQVKSFSFGCSLGKYHPSATSFMISVSTFLGSSKL